MTELVKGPNEIIVAQDGSPASLAAASVAIQIARSQNLPVRGLFVVDEALALDIYADYHRELDSHGAPASRSELLSWLEEQGDAVLRRLKVRCEAAGVPVTAELLAGGVADMVLRASEQARLLAMGRRGHSHEHNGHHLGRSFQTIAHHAHLPLVIGGDEERTVHRLLLAYDGSQHAQPAVAWAALLQRTLPADVIAVAVQEDGLQATDEWLADARTQLDGCRCVHRLGQPHREIVAVAEENDVDLILMGRYRHARLLEGLIGSTVDRVLRHTQLPVLMA